MSASKVWYVTGASQGLGLVLVKTLLSSGHRVAATSRSVDVLKEAVGDYAQQFLPLSVDLNNIDSIRRSVEQTLITFGQLDVLVNNAGYGMTGPVEEIEEKKIRNIFDINVLATISVTKCVLPVMRAQRSGYLINIASVAGFVGSPGWSVYSATKAAVIGFSEVLAADVKEFGIKVTVVEPSGFRTGFLTKDSLVVSANKIAGYEAVKNVQEHYLAMNGNQPGDPEKAAEILMRLAENPKPPIHLFLGADAVKRAMEKIGALSGELEEWKSVSVDADFRL